MVKCRGCFYLGGGGATQKVVKSTWGKLTTLWMITVGSQFYLKKTWGGLTTSRKYNPKTTAGIFDQYQSKVSQWWSKNTWAILGTFDDVVKKLRSSKVPETPGLYVFRWALHLLLDVFCRRECQYQDVSLKSTKSSFLFRQSAPVWRKNARTWSCVMWSLLYLDQAVLKKSKDNSDFMQLDFCYCVSLKWKTSITKPRDSGLISGNWVWLLQRRCWADWWESAASTGYFWPKSTFDDI